MEIIQIQNLDVKYERVHALNDVSFKINEGEFLGIIGPNGGGKTTLVKTILGLVKPTKGNITIADNSVVGYVPQFTTFDRNFPITVGEVILTGHLPKKIKPFHRRTDHEVGHAKQVMNELGIEELFDRQIGQLSGGQMQKVLIARALMNHPNILILDEPTAGVDAESRVNIYSMLKDLNERITILIISHNTDQLIKYLDRVIYVNQKIHIHENYSYPSDVVSEIDSCPIDWFIKGQDINRTLDQNYEVSSKR